MTTRSRSSWRSPARSSSSSVHDVRQSDTREDDGERASGCSSSSRSDVPVAAGADRPLERELVVAAHVHGESGLDGPSLPDVTTTVVDDDAIAFVARLIETATQPVTLVPTGRLRTSRYLEVHGGAGIERIVLMGGAIAEGNFTPAAEFNIWCDPDAAARVSSRAGST